MKHICQGQLIQDFKYYLSTKLSEPQVDRRSPPFERRELERNLTQRNHLKQNISKLALGL